MRHHLVLLAALLSTPSAFAGNGNILIEIRSDTEQTGSMLRQKRLAVPVSADKEYAQLSDEDKVRIRSDFDQLAPDDEPPYPQGGLASLCDGIVKAQIRRRAKGEMRMVAKIGADGSVQDVTTVVTPDEIMSTAVVQMLKLHKFKPALCKGQACAMEFPMRFRLSAN